MITERDVDQAIAECRAERDSNAWTCIRLAAFLTIRQQLFGGDMPPEGYAALPMHRGASFAAAPDAPPQDVIRYAGSSEFAIAIDGKRAAQLWPIIDELMSIVQGLYPDLYAATIKTIRSA